MKISALIIGYGSIAKKHLKCLKNIKKIDKIYIYSKRNIDYKYSINKLNQILEINPNYIIIASNTNEHYRHLKFIVNNFNHKIILVEKPLFHKNFNLKIKKNKVFIGYNLRMHPIIQFIKKHIYNELIFSVDVLCESFLPDWRKNRNYTDTYSAKNNLGGGVIMDLSHELDYLQWLFGSIIPKFSKVSKISNLKITSDDYFVLYGINNKKTHFNLSLNYFSKISSRLISIKGLNIYILADLIKNKIILIKNKKRKELFFKNLNIESHL